MSKKMYEFDDAVSMFKNGLQTLTKEVVSHGEIENSGIKLEYFDTEATEVLVSCVVDGVSTHLLLTQETRLPFGDSRKTIKDNGLDFLFQSSDDPIIGSWYFSDNISDDDNKVKYEVRNTFHDSYVETPLRSLLSERFLECKLILYFPVEGKQENVDGMAVLEIGNDLKENSGLVHYYSFRMIDHNNVSVL
jgi:hypothetical protein